MSAVICWDCRCYGGAHLTGCSLAPRPLTPTSQDYRLARLHGALSDADLERCRAWLASQGPEIALGSGLRDHSGSASQGAARMSAGLGMEASTGKGMGSGGRRAG